ncbi:MULTISPECIES: hypothetical protein [Burkholderia]|uniref:Uncharacterized protein n=2 Tax=Burkholderia cepacia complex TaxID=87882 RepID=A0AAP1V5G9_9BURK|nr:MULTISPECIES: hypothetical protein [Burkholderia]MBK1902005.1 hypothetical protein [Burkholderia contaminans]MBK1910288.1 hypothetical protein [Burkholderia contaminans]MBK1923747.1 hypothetical protein [Burkholderia contaminans]MBK1931959.1 hypothetical protein [Burkholderia contaminans]MBK1939208.1 hypothetical protein [Burkholderia contaminans]
MHQSIPLPALRSTVASLVSCLGIWFVFNLICVVAGLHPSRSFHALVVAQLTVAFVTNAYDVRIFQSVRAFAAIVAAGVAACFIAELIVTL